MNGHFPMENSDLSENLITRGSICDTFLTWHLGQRSYLRSIFSKNVGFSENCFPNKYEIWLEMGLESSILDETRWKWIPIPWLSLLDQFWPKNPMGKINLYDGMPRSHPPTPPPWPKSYPRIKKRSKTGLQGLIRRLGFISTRFRPKLTVLGPFRGKIQILWENNFARIQHFSKKWTSDSSSGPSARLKKYRILIL